MVVFVGIIVSSYARSLHLSLLGFVISGGNVKIQR